MKELIKRISNIDVLVLLDIGLIIIYTTIVIAAIALILT